MFIGFAVQAREKWRAARAGSSRRAGFLARAMLPRMLASCGQRRRNASCCADNDHSSAALSLGGGRCRADAARTCSAAARSPTRRGGSRCYDAIQLTPASEAEIRTSRFAELKSFALSYRGDLVEVSGWIKPGDELFFLGVDEADERPIPVDFDSLPRRERQAFLNACGEGCEATVQGRVTPGQFHHRHRRGQHRRALRCSFRRDARTSRRAWNLGLLTIHLGYGSSSSSQSCPTRSLPNLRSGHSFTSLKPAA